MPLSKKQLKFLKTKSHDLKPVIMIGQKGFSDEVLDEMNNALEHHELIKIKISIDDRDARKNIANEICKKSNSEQIQTIGKVLVIYRANHENPRIIFS